MALPPGHPGDRKLRELYSCGYGYREIAALCHLDPDIVLAAVIAPVPRGEGLGDTPEQRLANPAMSPCARKRPGCGVLGAWKPFYRAHVCAECLEADRADVAAGIWPF